MIKARWRQRAEAILAAGEKMCPSCRQTLCLEAFARSSRYLDGRQMECQALHAGAAPKQRAAQASSPPLGAAVAAGVRPVTGRPSVERQRAVLALMCELGLRKYRSDGRAVPADVAHVAAVVALGSPATAARCPCLLDAVASDVRAAVLRLATGPAVTGAAPNGPPLASWLTVDQAAAQLGISQHGVRARCRRRQLPATKHRITGRWRIDPAGISRSE